MTNHNKMNRNGYQLVLTVNTEYHLVDGCCVAARSLERGEFVTDHPLLGRSVLGCVTSLERRSVSRFPVIGGVLWFQVDGVAYLTSRIVATRLPEDRAFSGDSGPHLADLNDHHVTEETLPPMHTGPASLSLGEIEQSPSRKAAPAATTSSKGESDNLKSWLEALAW